MTDLEVETHEQMGGVMSLFQTGVLEGLNREPSERRTEDHAHRHTHEQKHRQMRALGTQGRGNTRKHWGIY